MKKLILSFALATLSALGFAQTYPSPTYNNLTVQGTATLHAATVQSTFTLTNPLAVSSGGTGASTAGGGALDNITGFSGTGFLTRTGAGTYTFQSLTNGITYGNLAQAGANTLLGNATGVTGNVTAVSVTGCNGAAQALQWTNGSGFQCNSSIATSGANSNITSLSGLSTPLSVGQGGTGATTASGARTNLVAAGSGANSDITSLSGLTTPLSVSQGGTGGATLAQYQPLAGSGTGAITTLGTGTAGQVLTSNGPSAYPTFQTLSALSGRLIAVTTFTSSGTWTPNASTHSWYAEGIGGGGGGGGAAAAASGQVAPGGGGAAGSFFKHYTTSVPGAQTITIGTGGAGGAAGNNAGTAGGTTSIGALISAPGGNGGAGAGSTAPPFTQQGGTPGSASTGASIVNSAGEPGGFSNGIAAGDCISGIGGSSPFGGGGTAAINTAAGNNASGRGAGGGGASSNNTGAAQAGGKGGDGIVIIWEYN
jgi:hypothetical protein